VGPVSGRFSAEAIVDEAYALVRRGDLAQGMTRLYAVLEAARARRRPAAWQAFIRDEVLRHPIREFVHRDPATRRSFAKPRGYPGDAVLLDYLYGMSREKDCDPADETARSLMRITTNSPSAVAVRNRRQLFARIIDASADLKPGCRVTCLAAGHFREGALSRAVQHRTIRILAIDQDADSLAVVRRTHAPETVTTLTGSVRHIVKGRLRLPPSDLIYASGLFDYLPDLLARRLVTVLFDSLAPDGRLVVANFAPGAPDRGFMEALGGWFLRYRSEDDVRRLFARVPASRIGAVSCVRDGSGTIVFCSAQRST
jgi:SAM-dependent methyltransferase